MNWTPGVIAGLVAIAALFLLALRAPRLALMGYTEALRRPKQLPIIAVGLMLATTIAVFAGVMSDTTGNAIEDEVLARLGETDVLVHGVDGTPFEVALADAALARSEVAFQVQDSLTTLRWPLSIQDDATGLGSGSAFVWGVPDTVGARDSGLLHLVPVSGVLPGKGAWSDGSVVLNQPLADELGAQVGDAVTLYVRPAALAPSTVDEGSFTHDNPIRLSIEVPDGSYRLRATIVTEDVANVTLTLDAPEPGAYRFEHGETRPPAHDPDAPPGAQITLERGASLPGGTWDVTARLLNESTGRVIVEVIGPPGVSPPGVTSATVVAIVQGTGSDAVGAGPRAYMGLSHLGRLVGSGEIANVVQVDAFRDETLTRLTSDLQAAFEAEAAGGYDELLSKTARVSVANVRGIMSVEADEAGRDFREDTFFYGSFNLLAGFLLIVVLMALLVEERRTGLAALRATGAGRRDLVLMHLHEGSVYALFSTLFGVAGGLGLSALYATLDPLRQGGRAAGGLSLVLDPQTVLDAAGAGFFLTIVGITLATARLVRFNVARGLRGLEDRRRGLSWPGRLGYVAAILVAGWLVWWTRADGQDGALAILAATTFILLLAGLLGRWLPRTFVYPSAGLVLVVYVIVQYVGLQRSDVLERDLALVPLRALLLVIGTTMVLVWSDIPARLAALLARQFRFLDPVADPSFGYPRSERTRTALTVAMLGVVVVMLITLTTFTALARPDIELDALGFGVVADADGAIALPAFLDDHPPKDGLNPFRNARSHHGVPFVAGGSHGARIDGSSVATVSGDMVGLTRPLVADAAVTGRTTDARYLDAADAMAAVTSDPTLAVAAGLRVGGGADPRLAEAGDIVTLANGQSLRIVASIEGGDFGDLLVHPSVVVAQEHARTRIFVQPHTDTDAAQVAQEVEAGLRAARVDAHALSELEAEAAAVSDSQEAFTRLFVGMGLVAGIASIGIITTRNVLERRNIIGVMRAVGAKRRQVAAIFTLETLFIAALSLMVGMISGLAASYITYWHAAPGRYSAWAVPWGTLFWLGLLVFGTALLTTVWPALRASNTPPAQATRYAE